MTVHRPRPVVDQVNDILRGRIRDRRYPAGTRLPSEIELAMELSVSRATVRSALARLAAEGLVIRRQGAGTFVNARAVAVNTSMGGMLDFSRLIASSGFEPTIRTLAADLRPASARECRLLSLADGAAVLALERLFLADRRPVIVAQNAIPANLLASLRPLPHADRPLHQFLEAEAGREMAYAIYDIGATLADEAAVGRLGGALGRPLLSLEATFFDRQSRPLATGDSLYDHAVLSLRLVQARG